MTAASRDEVHLTVKDLAVRLHTTPDAIYAMNKRGQAPPPLRRTGSKRGPLLYRLRDVEAWERTRLEPAP